MRKLAKKLDVENDIIASIGAADMSNAARASVEYI